MSELPTPQSRIEQYLDFICQNSGLLGFEVVLVDTTVYPTLEAFLASIGEEKKIYLYPASTTEEPDTYKEFLWIRTLQKYELIGTTAIDLSNYYTKAESDAALGFKLSKEELLNVRYLNTTEADVLETEVTTVVETGYTNPHVTTSLTTALDKRRRYKVTFNGTTTEIPANLWFTREDAHGTKPYTYLGNITLFETNTSGMIGDEIHSELDFLIIRDRNDDGKIEVFTRTAGTYTFKIKSVTRTANIIPALLLYGHEYTPFRFDANGDNGFNAFAIGSCNNILSKKGSFALGWGNKVNGTYATALGTGCICEGQSTRAYGTWAEALGDRCTATGNQTKSKGEDSYTEGYLTEANGTTNHAEGYNSYASGHTCHAEGYKTFACNQGNHVEGRDNKSLGLGSHSEGYMSYAIANFCHAEGRQNTCDGVSGHVEGIYNIVSRFAQHVGGSAAFIDNANIESKSGNNYNFLGDGTTTEFAFPSYVTVSSVASVQIDLVSVTGWTFADNKIKFTNAPAKNAFISVSFTGYGGNTKGNYLYIIGNGTDANNRSNAFTVDWSGNVRIKGSLYVGCNANSGGGVKLPPIPECPTGTNGNFKLRCTVSGGVPTYSWVAE